MSLPSVLNRPLNSSLPAQQIPLSIKLKDKDKFGVSEWSRMCLDGLESLGRSSFYNNLSLKENYEIINGRFILKHYLDSGDYFDLASAISQEFQLPNYLKHYDITTKAVNLLLGEFLKRPDIFRVVANDADSTNEKIRLKTELLQSYMQQSIHQEITQKLISQGIDPNRNDFQNEEEAQQYQAEIEQKYQEMTPEAIERYMKYDYRTAAESWGQAVLTNDKERFNLREQEKIEFTDMLVADRCFTHFYLTANGYEMETWNPINTFFHQSPEVRYVEDGDYVGRTFYMSKAQIIDRYGWRMSQEQQEALYPKYDKDKISQGAGYSTIFQTNVVPFQNYDDFLAVDKALGAAVGFNPSDRTSLSSIPVADEFDFNGLGNTYAFLQNDLVQVTEAYWSSQRRIGHLNITNPETGEQMTEMVDETFDPKLFGIEELKSTMREHTEPDSIVWIWTKQTWQGIKINENHLNSTVDTQYGRRGTYLDIRPADFQFKGDYNIFNSKLPVCGGIFNNRNGRSMAVVDLLKPYQIYYNALLNQAYGITQRNNGKFFLMDVNILPSLKDWGGEEALDKFMSVANSLGVAPIDSSTANPNNKGNSNFSHYQVIDLDETEKITRLINLAMLVEAQGFLQLGITPQRQGQTQASETAQGNMIAVNNSYAITETYFENYYNYKKRKLKMHLDIAQYCASKESDITLPYITSDLGNAFIKITGTELMLKDLGVNVTYSSETARQRQLTEQLLANNTTDIPMSKLVSMIRLNSLADIQKVLEQSEAENWKRKQEEMAQQKEIADMQIKAAAEDKQKDRDLKKYEIDTKAQVELEKITLQGIANEGSFDPEADLTDKLIAQRDLSLREREVDANIGIKQSEGVNKLIDSFNKRKIEESKQSFEQRIKKEEAKSKKEIETEKLRQVDSQNKSQEKIEKQSFQNDLKLQKEKHSGEMEKLEKEKELLELKRKMEEEKVKGKQKETIEKVNQIVKKTEVKAKIGDSKAKAEMKIADAKAKSVQEISKVDVDEAKEISKITIDKEKKKAVDDIKINKESAKIKLDVTKIKGTVQKKEAAKPPKKTK